MGRKDKNKTSLYCRSCWPAYAYLSQQVRKPYRAKMDDKGKYEEAGLYYIMTSGKEQMTIGR